MSDIQPGDVVVCVDNGPRPWHEPGEAEFTRAVLQCGSHYRCIGIADEADSDGVYPIEVRVLNFLGYDAWCPTRFRKIKAADEQFTALIRQRKPVEA